MLVLSLVYKLLTDMAAKHNGIIVPQELHGAVNETICVGKCVIQALFQVGDDLGQLTYLIFGRLELAAGDAISQLIRLPVKGNGMRMFCMAAQGGVQPVEIHANAGGNFGQLYGTQVHQLIEQLALIFAPLVMFMIHKVEAFCMRACQGGTRVGVLTNYALFTPIEANSGQIVKDVYHLPGFFFNGPPQATLLSRQSAHAAGAVSDVKFADGHQMKNFVKIVIVHYNTPS